MFDLNLIPVARQAGHDQPTVAGLHTAMPSRRPARGRESDRLLLYLTLAGSAPLAQEQTQALLKDLAETYYKSSGAVTAAMRAVAEALNTFILERNLRSSNTGRQSAGWLTQAVVRGDTLSLAHSGPVHSFIVGGEQAARHHFDPQSAGRGLGLSRQVGVRYFQSTLKPGVMLVLAHQPAASWTIESLAGSSQTPDTLRRLLISAPDPELSAVLLVPQPGSGKINMFRARLSSAPAPDVARTVTPSQAEPQPEPEQTAVVAEMPVESADDSAGFEDIPAVEGTGEPEADFEENILTETAEGFLNQSVSEQTQNTGDQDSVQIPISPAPIPTAPQAGNPGRPQTTPRRFPVSKPKPDRSAPFKETGAWVLRAGQAFSTATHAAFQQAARGLLTLLRRIMPDATMLDLPPSTLLFIAIAIPVMISVVAAVVYLERGKGMQHQAYLEQAVTAAEEGRSTADPVAQRSAWNTVLAQIELAEQYRVSNESQQLRLQAYSVLDKLDEITRLDFQPAIIGGLNPDIRVIRMATSGTDLYLLDGSSGNVLRAILTGGGYQVDSTFTCGPLTGPTAVGPLIDMVVMSRSTSQEQASVLAVDGNGMVLRCTPGSRPLAQELAPSATNFGSPRAIDLNNGDLYVLDPDANAVWIYRNLDLAQPPRFFFGDEIPKLQDVIDMIVNGDDLYLLHADGHQTRCTYSTLEGAPTRCEDPLLYTDRREGRQSGAVIPDAVFNQILFSPPPDPSLYLLDPANQAVYHFGMNLGFQRQYRAMLPSAGQKATAFTVAATRVVFLAFGNTVLYAPVP